MPVAGPA